MPKRKMPSSSVSVNIFAKNPEQKNMLKTISQNSITFVKGFAGSGKTHLAVGFGLQALLKNDYEQLVFTRPVIEAGGEKLGFLPGNMYEKIDPYMIPIFEILHKLIPPPLLKELMPQNINGSSNGNYSPIRILPLAFMRGTTFSNSFIVCDECQNLSTEQMRMILTRLGQGSTMVLCGDVCQTDIKSTNGLFDAFEMFQDIEGVGFVTLTQNAIMRHPIIQQIESRYLSRGSSKNIT